MRIMDDDMDNGMEIYCDIAKLSPNFSFNWAEMVFILNFSHHPPTRPPTQKSSELAKKRQSKYPMTIIKPY